VSYLFLIILIISPVFAGLDKIQIKNLDLKYEYPYGTGLVEKVSVGVSIKSQTNYPVEIHRRDDSFEVLSPFVDFQWMNPIPFFHNLQKVSLEKFNLKIDRNEHYLKGQSVQFAGEKTETFVFGKYDLNCAGSSVSVDVVERLKADCLDKMEASVEHMELPLQFLSEIASQLPDVPTETGAEIPANDFSLSVYKGDFFSYMRIKYVVRAYLKFWGHLQYENEGKTLAIRLDSVKFGVLPVTPLVFAELARQVNHPRVSINPPWIRIQLGNK
jgi:hypothetical protein